MPDLNATAASLLGFLHDGPKTGWDLQQAVEASIGNFWNVTRSQVYRELKTLATAALVTAGKTGERDRVPYMITKAGKKAFAKWIGREPEAGIMRMPLVVTVFFGSHVDPAKLRKSLQAARLEHETRRDGYVMVRPFVEEPFHRATLELGIASEETWIKWLNGLPWITEDQRLAETPARRTKARP